LWLEAGSKSSMGRFFIHIDAQDAQDFSYLKQLRVIQEGQKEIHEGT